MFEKQHLKKEITVNLRVPANRILCASTAVGNSVVFLGANQYNSNTSLVHVNAEGHILSLYNYDHRAMPSFGMMEEHKVIVLNVRQKKIDLINLNTKQILQVPHSYWYENPDEVKLITFTQTRLFCVAEYSYSSMRLVYYQYDFLDQNSRPITQFSDHSSYIDHLEKVNNFSKIGWWSFDQKTFLAFKCFDLKSDPKGHQSIVTTQKTEKLSDFSEVVYFGINYIWEVKENLYLLAVFENKYKTNLQYNSKFTKVNSYYLVDASLNPEKANLKPIQFTSDEVEKFTYHALIADSFNLERLPTFHISKSKTGKIIMIPMFTEKRSNGEIFYRGQKEIVSYFFPGWNGDCFVESIYNGGMCESITVRTHKIVDKLMVNAISLHLLLAINQDFDDDLLSDAVSLLCDE